MRATSEETSYAPEGLGENLGNGVVFAWAFLNSILWFWVCRLKVEIQETASDQTDIEFRSTLHCGMRKWKPWQEYIGRRRCQRIWIRFSCNHACRKIGCIQVLDLWSLVGIVVSQPV